MQSFATTKIPMTCDRDVEFYSREMIYWKSFYSIDHDVECQISALKNQWPIMCMSMNCLSIGITCLLADQYPIPNNLIIIVNFIQIDDEQNFWLTLISGACVTNRLKRFGLFFNRWSLNQHFKSMKRFIPASDLTPHGIWNQTTCVICVQSMNSKKK